MEKDSVTNPGGQAASAVTLGSLEAVLRNEGGKGPPPVECWNPPYCGDIGMKITSDGAWYYQGSPIGRKPLVRLFASVLRFDADGRHYLVTPVEKIDIEVADAPFLAVEMEVSGEGRTQALTFRTNVDDVVRCDGDHPIRFATEEVATGSATRDTRASGLKPYLRVRGGLDALVTRALYYDLIELAVTEERDGVEMLGIWSRGVFLGIAPVSAIGDIVDR